MPQPRQCAYDSQVGSVYSRTVYNAVQQTASEDYGNHEN